MSPTAVLPVVTGEAAEGELIAALCWAAADVQIEVPTETSNADLN